MYVGPLRGEYAREPFDEYIAVHEQSIRQSVFYSDISPPLPAGTPVRVPHIDWEPTGNPLVAVHTSSVTWTSKPVREWHVPVQAWGLLWGVLIAATILIALAILHA
jgi:hypothetical protein